MSYAYDGIGRLSSRTYGTSSSSRTLTQTLDYNVRGDLVSEDSDVFHSSLRYNVTRLGSTALYSGGISEWEWRRGSGSPANAGSLGGGGSYTHDANGNVTRDALAGLDLEYNLLNLTDKISIGDTVLANYAYLADGTRISAVRNDGTGVQYRGSLIYAKSSDGTLSLDCALTNGGRIVRQSGGSSAQTVTDPTNRWRFSGKEDQTFLGAGIACNNFGARLHDPRTGRWLAVDPMAQKYYGMTVYGYCGGYPISIIDDGGLDLILAGSNKSSVTFKTDLIEKSFDISRLGIDWGGSYSFEGDKLLSAALDLAGIFDPTSLSDLTNATIQYRNGDKIGASISTIGIIPYDGDLAKVSRIGKDIKVIGEAINGISYTNKNFRKNLTKLTGINPKYMQVHHIFPQKFREQFVNAGINIDEPQYGKWLETVLHLKGSYKYNQ